MINALRKSWNKMTDAGRAHAMQMRFGGKEKALLDRALTSG